MMNINFRRIAHKSVIPLVGLLTLFLLVSNAHAKKPRHIATAQNLGEFGQTLANYLGCARPLQSESDVEAIRQCATPLLAGGTDRARQDRFVSWLMLNPQIDEIRRCSNDDLQAAESFNERTFNHLCFQFKLNGQTRVGVAFFKGKTTKQRGGLYSIFY